MMKTKLRRDLVLRGREHVPSGDGGMPLRHIFYDVKAEMHQQIERKAEDAFGELSMGQWVSIPEHVDQLML